MSKVLSIEIGYSLVRVIETDLRSKNPKLHSVLNFETPKGAINDGQLNTDSVQDFGNALRLALDSAGIKTKQVVFTLSSTKIASREVLVPNVKDARLTSIIKANAPDYFPVDISQYEVDFQSIGLEDKGDGTSQRKVQVLAAPKSMLEGYNALAKAAGLTVVAFDYSANSIYQVIKGACKEGIEMVVKLDERSTIVTILEAGEVVLQRNVSYGVDDALETVIESEVYEASTYQQALATMRGQVCINPDFEPAKGKMIDGIIMAEPDAMDVARAQITMCFDNVIRGIGRVVDFYSSRNNGRKIDRAYTTGLGGDFRGLTELFSHECPYPVSELEAVVGPNEFKDGTIDMYIACLGAAIDPLGFCSEKVDEKKEFTTFKFDPAVASLFTVLLIVIAAALLVMAYLPYVEAKNKNNQLRKQVDDLSWSVTAYREYTSTKQAYDYINAMYKETETPLVELVEFIEEIEEKMPHSFFVQSFRADEETFSMDITVNTKEDAAEVIEQLRTFKALKSISTNGIYDDRTVVDPTEVAIERSAGIKVETDGSAMPKITNPAEGEDSVRTADQGYVATGPSMVTFSIQGVFKTPEELREEAQAAEAAQAQ